MSPPLPGIDSGDSSDLHRNNAARRLAHSASLDSPNGCVIIQLLLCLYRARWASGALGPA